MIAAALFTALYLGAVRPEPVGGQRLAQAPAPAQTSAHEVPLPPPPATKDGAVLDRKPPPPPPPPKKALSAEDEEIVKNLELLQNLELLEHADAFDPESKD